MNTKLPILAILLTLIIHIASLNAQEASDLLRAKTWFNELDSLCSLDHGRLWGVDLYGPTMFVFPESRIILANEPDSEGTLVEKDGVYVSQLPESINIANTSFNWNGKDWTMVNWGAIPENDAYSRAKLLIHESWHRMQEAIGIKPVMIQNTHLDQRQGSILMKLEFIALDSALISKGDNPTSHLANALKIRAYRQALFPGNNENAFERHEGMAEYTGYRLCGINQALLPKVVARQLEMGLDKEGLANSFAYLTGPAYGLLLDGSVPGWRNEVKQGATLPDIAGKLIDDRIPSDTTLLNKDVAAIVSQYKADAMIEQETERFKLQEQLVSAYEEKFLHNDILVIRNNNINMSFNPQEKLIPLENGVVYKTMRLTGEWGIAEVSNGIFRSNDWQLFILAAPASGNSGTLEEPDYHLMLNEGWKVVKIKEGKYMLSNQ